MTLCACAQPGFCDVYHRMMNGRAWEICSGQGAPITADKRKAYLELWKSVEFQAAHKGEIPLRHPPLDGKHRLKTCAHRQRALRDALGQPLTLVPP